MHVRYDKLVPSLKTLLPEATLSVLGRAVAFIRRLRQIEACAFVWSVVLSRFGSGRPGFEQARQWYGRLGGSRLWPRPFQVRFKSERAVKLFEQAFETAVIPWRDPARRRARHPLARCFPDVVAWDSTVMQVADSLKNVFKGTRAAKASVKACLGISVFGLLPLFAKVVAGNRHDMVLFPPLHLFQHGTLLLFDKGFACYDRLRTIGNSGLHYLCPMRLNGNAQIVGIHSAPVHVRKALRTHRHDLFLRDVLPANKRIGRAWDLEVLVRAQANAQDKTWIRTRLVIVPGPKGNQHPYLTNLGSKLWKPRALRELYRLRWQIELVFKELKQHLNLDALPSADAHAVQVFVWASLIALALSRCVSAWIQPLARMATLASAIRPQLVTRALRSTVRILGRALVERGRRALTYVRLLAEELLCESKSLETSREDSFKRITPLLTRAA